ncbi:MAG: tetratricopeptide repeat protein [Gammaproteobacteria bacterium]|nr:tetratricopeptide repeat protein [Gammaproteobacteria bacterium]MDH3506139.1 tetratricopeptide repeat protein [Gammaproteobacteria bacterium]
MDPANLERLIADGKDSATLRFALGAAYLKQEKMTHAIRHLGAAVEMNPGYSAAWKLLGKAYANAGQTEEAKQSYESGIAVALERGDAQAAREMQVFLRRLTAAATRPDQSG